MTFHSNQIDEMEAKSVGNDGQDESSSILSTDSYGATTTFNESVTGQNLNDQKMIKDTEEIRTSEQSTKEVRQVRLIVLLVLLVSIAGAIAVFFYTKNSEQQQFEFQFQYDSNKVRTPTPSPMELRP